MEGDYERILKNIEFVRDERRNNFAPCAMLTMNDVEESMKEQGECRNI